MEQFTQKAKRALELAYDTAEELGHRHIGSEHILCGLIREQTGLAARVLGLNHIDENAAQSAPAIPPAQSVSWNRAIRNRFGSALP